MTGNTDLVSAVTASFILGQLTKMCQWK